MTDEERLDYYYQCNRFYTSANADLLMRGKHDANNIYSPFPEYRTVVDKNVEKNLPYIFKNHLCNITHYDNVDLSQGQDFYLIELDPSLGYNYAASGIPANSTQPDSVVDCLAIYGYDDEMHICGYEKSSISAKRNLKNPVVLQK